MTNLNDLLLDIEEKINSYDSSNRKDKEHIAYLKTLRENIIYKQNELSNLSNIMKEKYEHIYMEEFKNKLDKYDATPIVLDIELREYEEEKLEPIRYVVAIRKRT